MRDNLRHRLNRMTPSRVGVLDSIRIGNSHRSEVGFSHNLLQPLLIISSKTKGSVLNGELVKINPSNIWQLDDLVGHLPVRG